MSIWTSLGGSLELELISPDLPAALAALNALNVEICRLRWNGELSCVFRIRRSHYRKTAAIVKKRGETLRIRRHLGLYWPGKRLLKRPVLVSGLGFCLALSLWLPGRVLFIRVEGNQTVPAARILEAAERCGIAFGASRKEIRSEKAKNGILSEIPQLQWAGVNTSGCTATVSVREGMLPKEEGLEPAVSHIVAGTDGFVLSGTVLRGNGLFRPGQTVRKGQILISGYTDCGFSIRAERSSGEIMAQTNRELEAVMDPNYLQRGQILETGRSVSLIIRKKRINLWKDSGIYDATCGRMYAEYYVTLPGGYQLPVSVCIEDHIRYGLLPGKTELSQGREQLESFAGTYLPGRMISGTVHRSRQSVTPENGVFRLRGSYICREMIGRELPEEIGELHGKNH